MQILCQEWIALGYNLDDNLQTIFTSSLNGTHTLLARPRAPGVTSNASCSIYRAIRALEEATHSRRLMERLGVTLKQKIAIFISQKNFTFSLKFQGKS